MIVNQTLCRELAEVLAQSRQHEWGPLQLQDRIVALLSEYDPPQAMQHAKRPMSLVMYTTHYRQLLDKLLQATRPPAAEEVRRIKVDEVLSEFIVSQECASMDSVEGLCRDLKRQSEQFFRDYKRPLDLADIRPHVLSWLENRLVLAPKDPNAVDPIKQAYQEYEQTQQANMLQQVGQLGREVWRIITGHAIFEVRGGVQQKLPLGVYLREESAKASYELMTKLRPDVSLVGEAVPLMRVVSAKEELYFLLVGGESYDVTHAEAKLRSDLRRQALAKLTDAEKAALGLTTESDPLVFPDDPQLKTEVMKAMGLQTPES